VAIFGFIALTAIPASAQEISFGYQWQKFFIDFDDSEDLFVEDSLTAPLGFNFDVSAPLAESLDLVGQVDWSRQSEGFDLFGEDFSVSTNFFTFAGGIRWTSRSNPSAMPFIQALFGATRSSIGCDVAGFECEDFLDDTSSTASMLQFGGGVAIPVGGWALVPQVDYRRLFEDEGTNAIRLVIGARFNLR
jgi:hypothetical protein